VREPACGRDPAQRQPEGSISMDGILQIVVVVLIVLFIVGYFGRGRFRV
jgi:hypothetical protein